MVTHLFRAVRLPPMQVLEEAGDREDIGPGVHEDEEEDPGEVEARVRRVVLHHAVQQGRDLLHQNRVEGQQQLQAVVVVVVVRISTIHQNIIITTYTIGSYNGEVIEHNK